MFFNYSILLKNLDQRTKQTFIQIDKSFEHIQSRVELEKIKRKKQRFKMLNFDVDPNVHS